MNAFRTSEDGVLVLGFADELPPPPDVIHWHFEPVLTRGLCLVPLIKGQALSSPRVALWNVSTRKVGGLRFVKLGRLCFMVCITKGYKPL